MEVQRRNVSDASNRKSSKVVFLGKPLLSVDGKVYEPNRLRRKQDGKRKRR
mgnify:CR=1 FL=1